MRKMLFILCMASMIFSANAQILKVEHFNAHTTHAADLFEMFKTKFKLPVVYEYAAFGNYNSGGLWLGNTTLEFVNYEGLDPAKAIFKGIALEPIQHTDTIIRMLDEYGIAHDPPAPEKFRTNIVLKDLTSEDMRVFVCDYTSRAFVNDPKKAARKILAEENGGPLGIIGLKKIVIETTDLEKTLHAWISIPGAQKTGSNHFRFFEGPEIVVEKAGKNAVREIMIQVRSVDEASKFLSANNMLVIENANILIDPKKLSGLRIILQQ